MMHRNLDQRVETLVGLTSPQLRQRLKSILELSLADNTASWALGENGRWARVSPGDGRSVSSQAELMRLAATRAAKSTREGLSPTTPPLDEAS
jgi:polyphosphate kinase